MNSYIYRTATISILNYQFYLKHAILATVICVHFRGVMFSKF